VCADVDIGVPASAGPRPFALVLALLASCDRGHTTAPTTRPANPTIASTVPAVTDLIIGMGARDRLVAVSTYDRDRADVGAMPKAGDYDTVDWELLATLRPAVLITAIAPDRRPAGFRERAAGLHIALDNVQVNKLDDLDPALAKIGEALDEPALATAAERRMHDRFDAVRHRVAGLQPVPALILHSGDASAVAGPGTYLDDLLTLAGGRNAAASLGQPWPTVDRETLASLHPDVVLLLLPNATPAAVAAATATWDRMPGRRRLCVITDDYALQPGWHLPDLADRFTECLHPSPSTTRPADR
jgi:iron complex transport system substrate-binding protein